MKLGDKVSTGFPKDRLALAIVGVAVVIFASVFADGDEAPELDLADAGRRMQRVVDASVRKVAGTLDAHTLEPRDTRPCIDQLGFPEGSSYVAYSVEIELKRDTDVTALIERAATYWESEGLRTVSGPLDSAQPMVSAERDGFEYLLSVMPEENEAVIDGRTPCVRAE